MEMMGIKKKKSTEAEKANGGWRIIKAGKSSGEGSGAQQAAVDQSDRMNRQRSRKKEKRKREKRER